MEPSKPPRVFISYSWESEDHKRWVRHLGERLYHAGIEARLDQWFIKPGESFTQFMEQEVEKADFVIVVCTPTYAQKSNKRHGGVGYEQQIVSGQLMAGTARSKFIPILRIGSHELGPECAVPTHFLGIAWIEFRNEAAFEHSFEELIRAIHSKPRFVPPPLGIPPPLTTSSTTTLTQFNPNKNRPIEIFYSYAHQDEAFRENLEEHLSLMKRDREIMSWHDRGIVAGSEWEDSIGKHLESAGIILLLVSANYLASNYCYEIEMKRAMERHEAGEAIVIPIILTSCHWNTAPFGKLQALPKDAKPIKTWADPDEAYADVVVGIRKAIAEINRHS